MKRRELMTLLGGAALAGALPAAAQKRPALIGLLGNGSAQSSGIFVDSLKEGLSDGGLREGRDYVLDLRWAEGSYERFPALARELVERKADFIACGCTMNSSSQTGLRFGYLTPVLALSLGIVLAGLASVQTANAQTLKAGRERNLRECSLAEKRAQPDSEEKSKTGSRDFRYTACMRDRGDVE